METFPQAAGYSENENSFVSFIKDKWLLLFLLPLFIVVILILNYFNILVLSLRFPALGFLPHKSFNQTFGTYVQNTVTKNTDNLNPPYQCPVGKDACQKGEIASIAKAVPPFIGLAFDNLASGSAVYAITPGHYNSGVLVDKVGNKATVLTILDNVKNVEVDYQFQGKAYTPLGSGRGDVKQGDVIGWVSDQKLPQGLLDKPYSLIVSVQDLKNKSFIQLDLDKLLKSTK